MPTIYKILGQLSPAPNSDGDIYTVPLDTTAVTSTLSVCNRTPTSKTYRVAVRPEGATLSNVHYIAYDIPLNGGDSVMMTIGMTLQANTVVTVRSQGDMTFNLFGSEITA
jgi:hypothetical protein